MNVKNIKIAVTGVGGGVGQSIIKGLNNTDYTVVGLEADTLATGLYALPIAYKIPKVSDPHYLKEIMRICIKERCQLLFPGLDTELLTLSEHAEQFKKIGTTVVISRPEVVKIADNKFLTYKLLSENGIAVPATYMLDDYLKNKHVIKFPAVVKPTVGGSRSIDVHSLKDLDELTWLISKKGFKTAQYIIQEMIAGDEYTCGSVNLDGNCVGVIIMRRILRDGDTYKCFIVKNKSIEKTVYKIMEILKPFGACNVQLRIQNGVPTVFEINARCSGTSGARALAGFNEPKMIADYLLFGKKPSYQIKMLAFLRYWKELIVEYKNIEKVESAHRLINKSFSKL